MSGESVIPSVLSRCSKDLKWQTSVIALLQLSFIQQAKDSTPLRHEGGPIPKERAQSFLASSFYMFCLLPLSLLCANWASQEGRVSREVLTPVHRFSFVSFSWALSFLCFSSPPFWTPFSYSNYPTKPKVKIQNV